MSFLANDYPEIIYSGDEGEVRCEISVRRLSSGFHHVWWRAVSLPVDATVESGLSVCT
jgi:hypothetical protein